MEKIQSLPLQYRIVENRQYGRVLSRICIGRIWDKQDGQQIADMFHEKTINTGSYFELVCNSKVVYTTQKTEGKRNDERMPTK